MSDTFKYSTGSIHEKLIRSVIRYADLCEKEIVTLREESARKSEEIQRLKKLVGKTPLTARLK